MNKKLIALGSFLFLSAGVFAQEKGPFGPDAKNMKPWEKKDDVKQTVVIAEKIPLIGPRAKNISAAERLQKPVELEAIRVKDKPKLTGPAFKNRKPWKTN